MACRHRSVLLGLVCGLFVDGLTITVASAGANPESSLNRRDIQRFNEVLAHIYTRYIDRPDRAKLLRSALSGLVAALDPHSEYLSPALFSQLKADAKGEYGGIGVELAYRSGLLSVVSVSAGGSAARAGLRPGDQIVRIDGRQADALTLEESIARLRGISGSRVALTIRRKPNPVVAKRFSHDSYLDLTLMRQRIKIRSIVFRRLSADVAYARVKVFQRKTAKKLAAILTRAGPIPALVLDLRDNPGGLMSESLRVANLFLRRGMIVRTRGRSGIIIRERFADPKGTLAPVALVCLVNEGSASGAEIVAGALQYHHRAHLLGRTTFGKGSVQTVIPLRDGAALKVTVARYELQDGRMIDGQGIVPDQISEKRGRALVDEALALLRRQGHKNSGRWQPIRAAR